MSRVLNGWCAGAAALCTIAGLVVLVGGWALGVEALAFMKRATATCFVLAGAALWVLGERPASARIRILADGAAAVVAVLAALALASSLGEPGSSGRMASLTALCFLLLALGLLSVDRGPIFPTGQRLAVASGFVALLGVATWAYEFGAARDSTPGDMAALTAVLLVVLSIGVAAARPARGVTGIFAQDTAGGMVARWVLPGTLLGSLLIGGIGLAGERAGLYAREFGAALTTVASLSLFSALVWFIAVRLHRTDVRRLSAELELRRSNADLEARVEARTRALAESEAQYRRLIDESPDGIMIHQQGVVRFLNPAGLRMFGLSEPAQAVGLSVLDYIAPAHRAAVAERVAARLRGEPLLDLVQLEATRPDGKSFWIGAAATVVDWEGSPAILVSFMDVTEQRRLETAEREAESLRAVTKLANAAAHEINNPLTVVGGNIHLLAARLTDRPDLQRYSDRALKGVQSIADMIIDMTRITRLTPLTHLDTAGIQTLDLHRSSHTPEPGAAPAPAPGKAPEEPPRPL